VVGFVTDEKSVTAMNGRNQIFPLEKREANAGWRQASQARVTPQLQEVTDDPQRFY
jgi:hypothetical protein